MRAQFVGSEGFEFGQVRVRPAVVAFVVEALEIVGNIGDAGTLGQTNALALADNRDGMAMALIGEEVVKADTEDQGDTKQRRQRGIEFVALELGEKRRGQSGVLAEFDEAHTLLQAQGTEFGSDLIRAQIVIDGFANQGSPQDFLPMTNMSQLFSCGEQEVCVATSLSR